MLGLVKDGAVIKVMILGAAGQIGRMVTKNLLEQTDDELVLYGRNVSERLRGFASDLVSLVDGTFEEVARIKKHLAGVDAVYLSFVAGPQIVGSLIKVLDEVGMKKFIACNVPDIYQEVTGKFQAWYRKHTGLTWRSSRLVSAQLMENSDLDYIILRITWLYNQDGNTAIHVTKKVEPFTESQITWQVVAQFVTDLLTGKADYHRESLGIGEPNTDWEKPSFY